MEHRPTTLESLRLGPGSIVADRYEVCARIGSGGMGEVFRVIDRELDGEIVALKLLHPHLAENEEVFRRFRNEVLVARSLSHPNVVRTHDIGRAQGNFMYISMEYVDGVSLRDKLQSLDSEHPETSSSGLAFEDAVSIMFQILSGVSYAHGKGIVHRDLKPANVIMSKTGEVKLADFGTARILGMDTSITRAGSMIGTPDYMSPEQIRGEKLDHLCDVYSLGIIAYELVVGKKPFSADTPVAVAFKHLNEPLPDIGRFNHNVPEWYQNAARKAAAKDRTERFQSASAFAAELVRHMPSIAGSSGFFSIDEPHALGTVVGPSATTPKNKKEFELGDASRSTSDRWTLDFDAKTGNDSWSMSGDNSESRPNIPSVAKTKKGRMTVAAFLGLFLVFALFVAFVRLSSSANSKAANFFAPILAGDSTLKSVLSGLLALRLQENETPSQTSELLSVGADDASERNLLEHELLGFSRNEAVSDGKSPADAGAMAAENAQVPITGAQEITPRAADGSSGEKEDTTAPIAEVRNLAAEQKKTETMPISDGKQEVAPEKKRVEQEPKPVPTAVAQPEPTALPPTPIPQVVSGTLALKKGSEAADVGSVSVDALPAVKWQASASGLSNLSDVDKKRLSSELYLNIFSADSTSVIARVQPTQVVEEGKGSGRYLAEGTLGGLKAKNPGAGSYRADLVFKGEVLASKALSLYRASVSYAGSASEQNKGGRIAVVRGPSVVEPSSTARATVNQAVTGDAITAGSTLTPPGTSPGIPPGGAPQASSVPTRASAATVGDKEPSYAGSRFESKPFVSDSRLPVYSGGSAPEPSSFDELPRAKGFLPVEAQRQQAPSSLGSGMNEQRGSQYAAQGLSQEQSAQTPGGLFNTPSAVRENYSGFFMFSATDAGPKERRSLRLELEIAGESISGRAYIDGFAPCVVVGKIHTRGLELELQNEQYWMRLSASRRGAAVLRGQYSLPALKQRGAWEASRM